MLSLFVCCCSFVRSFVLVVLVVVVVVVVVAVVAVVVVVVVAVAVQPQGDRTSNGYRISLTQLKQQ